ncbi:hypothetical protein GRX03_03595 [Halovenus sp. WSH3]|uniref:Blue (type 1) copper domain-containing protein n=1 Tax=Halovenus carboxidivorans TaxID=2692199 RepID=A0A6B0T5U1_9EURY|nr:hypothetical protein [Halovenus carboxidivorans]
MGRRQVLTALGAAAMPAVAGCSSESNEPDENTTSADTEPDMNGTTQQEQTNGQAIEPRFGYVGTGEEPPVEPDHTVQLLIREREEAPIPQFYFEPTGLAIEPGDTVRFQMTTPHHNVNAYHPAFGYTQRVPESAPAYSSPVLGAGEYWLYTFETEGVHNIMCAPHELFGMVGSIVVGSPTGPAASAVGEAPGPSEARPPEFTAGLVLSDPALAPENIVEAGSVSWDDLAPESKALRLAPIGEE